MVDFLIPSDGALDEFSFLSDGPPSRFFRKVAEEMDIERKYLHIGYKFSTSKASDMPRKLDTAKHLEQLFAKAKKEIIKLNKSRSRTKKEFQVTIVDLTPKEKGKKGKVKEKEKRTARKVCARCICV